jgi:hypothetical protein
MSDKIPHFRRRLLVWVTKKWSLREKTSLEVIREKKGKYLYAGKRRTTLRT